MDVRAHFSVLWRFRALVALGLLVGIALAVLSVARISFAGGTPTLSYRKAVVWASGGTMLVTQPGAPFGRSTLNDLVPVNGAVTGQQSPAVAPRFADPSRYTDLASLYAQLVGSDPVQQAVRSKVSRGSVTASTIGGSSGGSSALPLISFVGTGNSPDDARRVAAAGMQSLREYITQQQNASDVPDSERVVLQTVNAPLGASVVKPRSKMLPIVVLFGVLAAFMGAAFLLENLRPRVAVVPIRAAEEDERPSSAAGASRAG